MTRAHSHFQPIGELPSEYGLTIWGYATRREPAAVLAPGYFQAYTHHLRVGDLLLVRHTGDTPRAEPAPAAPTLALFGIDRDGRGTVVLHEIWRFDWAEARAAARAVRTPDPRTSAVPHDAAHAGAAPTGNTPEGTAAADPDLTATAGDGETTTAAPVPAVGAKAGGAARKPRGAAGRVRG